MTSFFTFDFSELSGSSHYDDNPRERDHHGTCTCNDNCDDDDDRNKYNYQQRTKFGKVIDWLDSRHMDGDELEKYRMVGDDEVDNLLDLIIRSSSSSYLYPSHNHHGGGKRMNDSISSSTSLSTSLSTSASFRFMDVVSSCATLYNNTNSQYNYQLDNEQMEEEKEEEEKLPFLVDDTPNHHQNETDIDIDIETERAMIQFYNHYYNTANIPPWVDWDQIQRGIDVFIKYIPAIGQSLYYLSLVPGFSIPKIAKVLQMTNYLSPPSTTAQVKRRLLDTGGFLMSCMAQCNSSNNKSSNSISNSNSNSNRASTKETEDADADASASASASANCEKNEANAAAGVRPGGVGWEMALRVRVLHAKIRRMILESSSITNDDNGYGSGNSSKRTKSETKWNVNEYGIPINQEDMAATLLAFSVNALSGIELIAGKPLSNDEQLDYIAFWRYLGWLLGVYTKEGEEQQQNQDSTNTSGCSYNGNINDNCDNNDNNNVEKEKGATSSTFLPPLDPCGPGVVGSKTCNNNNPLVHSRAMLESIIYHLMHPDESSCIISNHLLQVGNNNNNADQRKDQTQTQRQSMATSSSSFSKNNDTLLSFGYLYRSFMCRRFIGDELSDALKLIRPSHSSLKHIVAYHLTLVILLVLRIYTLLTIHSSWFARGARKRHSKMVSKFFLIWKRENKKRVDAMSRMSFRNSLSTKTGNTMHIESMSINDNNRSLGCPFSLLMPPIQSDELIDDINDDLNNDLDVKLKKMKNE